MREYKFRGKRLDNGEWVEGFGVEVYETMGNETKACLYTNQDEYMVVNNYFVDPATVGQYTGRQDEEKTDIYDGDKLYAKGNLSDELQYIGTVVWDNEDCRFEVVNYLQSGRFEWIPDGCVVRGSIHDPELLEG